MYFKGLSLRYVANIFISSFDYFSNLIILIIYSVLRSQLMFEIQPYMWEIAFYKIVKTVYDTSY